MDDYFDLTTEDEGSFRNNEGLLDGIVSSLQDAATDAYTACDLMYQPFALVPDGPEAQLEQWKDEIRQRFLRFSDADIEPGSRDGLQGIIDDLGRIRETLLENSKTELTQAHDMLADWRGDAANAAKYYVLKLSEEYDTVATKMSILQSDVVAAREVVAKGRNDLRNLAGSFRSAAEQWHKAAEANERGASEVLTDAFAGAVAGLLAVPTGGTSLLAAGALIAGNVAGSMVVGGLSHQPLAGDKPKDIDQDFIDALDDVEKGTGSAVDKLVHDIDALPTPQLQDPPDVSPGRTFDPAEFGTTDMPPETEKNVRKSGRTFRSTSPATVSGSVSRLRRTSRNR